MFRLKAAILLAVIAALLMIQVAVADEGRSCLFTGTVELDGNGVPDGTLITATIEGDDYHTHTPTGYGPSTYGITIVHPEGKSYPDVAEVTFHINGSPAEQTSTFVAGSHVRLDLSGTASVSSPSPVIWPIMTPILAVILVVCLIYYLIILRRFFRKRSAGKG